MGLRIVVTSFVVAIVTIAFAPLPSGAQQQVESVTDPVAYAVYAEVLPAAWATVSKDILLLQQETEDIDAVSNCLSSSSDATADPEWDAVQASFKLANAQVRVLRRTLPVDI